MCCSHTRTGYVNSQNTAAQLKTDVGTLSADILQEEIERLENVTYLNGTITNETQARVACCTSLANNITYIYTLLNVSNSTAGDLFRTVEDLGA